MGWVLGGVVVGVGVCAVVRWVWGRVVLWWAWGVWFVCCALVGCAARRGVTLGRWFSSVGAGWGCGGALR